jgi:hypothetical protein
MATVRSVHRNPVPRGLAIAPLLLALGAFAPAALAEPQASHDDVSYGDIPQATLGAAAAPATGAVADGHDDVSYGSAPLATFAFDLPAADPSVALGRDDVTYPAAEPQRSGEAAVATTGVVEGAEVRASDDGSRNAASHAEAGR